MRAGQAAQAGPKPPWDKMEGSLAWVFMIFGCVCVEVRAPMYRPELVWFEFAIHAKGERMGLSYPFDQMWGRRKEVWLKTSQQRNI